LAAIAVGESAGSPTDPSEAGVDLERTAEVFSRLVPLLRQLRDRASAAAAPTHDCRILSGGPPSATQDANNERPEQCPEDFGDQRRCPERSVSGRDEGWPD
jgi:hypothetical protein